MKFTVEVENFWLEEEELSNALQQAIKTDVIRKIQDNIKVQVEKLVENKILSVINAELETRAKVLTDEFVAKGKVRGRYSSDPERTVEQYIADEFKSKEQDIKKYIEANAKAQGEELKKRYDLLFASQIVAKINEQGLLKEDVAKLLLPKTDN